MEEEHECYYRGCKTMTVDRYCDRHQQIDSNRKATIARRASERAVERRTSRAPNRHQAGAVE